MKNQKIKILMILILTPLSTLTQAEAYLGIHGGINLADDQRLRQNGYSFVQMEFENNLKDAYTYGATAGWMFDVGIRPELEISKTKNKLDQFSDRIYEGNSSTPAKGSLETTQVLTNLWYQFPEISKLKPYLGFGLGYISVKGKSIETVDGKFGTLSDDVFGYQIGGGLGYSINPHLITSLDYRYIKTSEVDFGDVKGLPDGHVTTKYKSNALKLSLNYLF